MPKMAKTFFLKSEFDNINYMYKFKIFIHG